jgi:hypothetical protein
MTTEKILALNHAPLHADAGVGQNPAGRICAANESRFTSSHYSDPLTAYTVGWRDPENLDALLDHLFPAVPVGRRFEFKQADNDEAFLSETDDVRAIGASFKRVEYRGSSVNEKTFNKGLTIRVDHDDEVGDGWRETYVQMLLQRLLRNELRRGLALIDAASTNTSATWNSSANPDGDVRTALKAGADASGIWPNTVLFGEAAWNLRLDAYEAQNTPYAGRAAAMSKLELAQKYMVDTVEVLKTRYQSAAAAKSGMLGLAAYGYYALPGLTKDDPSNVKRFLTPARGGKYGVYVMEHEKFTDISVEMYSNIVITSTRGIRKLTVAAS